MTRRRRWSPGTSPGGQGCLSTVGGRTAGHCREHVNNTSACVFRAGIGFMGGRHAQTCMHASIATQGPAKKGGGVRMHRTTSGKGSQGGRPTCQMRPWLASRTPLSSKSVCWSRCRVGDAAAKWASSRAASSERTRGSAMAMVMCDSPDNGAATTARCQSGLTLPSLPEDWQFAPVRVGRRGASGVLEALCSPRQGFMVTGQAGSSPQLLPRPRPRSTIPSYRSGVFLDSLSSVMCDEALVARCPFTFACACSGARSVARFPTAILQRVRVQ